MEIIPKTFDLLSTVSLSLILIIFIVRNRKNREVTLETLYKELIEPLRRPAIMFTLLREHYYCRGEEDKGIMIAAVVMALMIITAEYALRGRVEKTEEDVE